MCIIRAGFISLLLGNALPYQRLEYGLLDEVYISEYPVPSLKTRKLIIAEIYLKREMLHYQLFFISESTHSL